MPVAVIKGLFLALLTGVLSVVALLGASAFKWAGELPDLSELDVLGYSATSRVYARDGTLIGEILPAVGEGRELTNRIPVTLDEVSPAALMAIVSYEDDEFFDHYLLGKPRPEWMDKGVSFLDRGTRDVSGMFKRIVPPPPATKSGGGQ